MKKKVFFVFFGSGRFRYGVARVFFHLINGLDKNKFDIVLVVSGTLEEQVHGLSKDVHVIELNKKGGKAAFFSLISVVREMRPDIIFSAMEHPNVLAVLARFFSGVDAKLVISSHGALSPRLKHMWSTKAGLMIKGLVNLTYAFANHLVCVSHYTLDDLRKNVRFLPSASVIYNPVFPENHDFGCAYESKLPGLIVTSSRLVSLKCIDEAVKALLHLDDYYHLVVLGDGPERGPLETLVDDLGLGDRVRFEGFVSDPFSWYKKAEFLVLPSRWEGFGNVLVEAMACGCQVVANADAGAPSEVLGHGEYGFLYEGGDSLNLAIAIKDASKNPKSRDKLVEYARIFTDSSVAKKYEEIFDSLMGVDSEIGGAA